MLISRASYGFKENWMLPEYVRTVSNQSKCWLKDRGVLIALVNSAACMALWGKDVTLAWTKSLMGCGSDWVECWIGEAALDCSILFCLSSSIYLKALSDFFVVPFGSRWRGSLKVSSPSKILRIVRYITCNISGVLNLWAFRLTKPSWRNLYKTA